MPTFVATLDPHGVIQGANEAKRAVAGLGDSFDTMQKRGGNPGRKEAAAMLEYSEKQRLNIRDKKQQRVRSFPASTPGTPQGKFMRPEARASRVFRTIHSGRGSL